MKTYDNRRPDFGRVAKCEKDYQWWWMAKESRGYTDRCTEINWRIRRIDEAAEMELVLTVEWLRTAGQMERSA